MEGNDLIAADVFCVQYNIELSFIRDIHEYGLIEITTVQDRTFIPAKQLSKLEQIIRLHFDLDINIEGIEAVTHLLERITSMQDQILFLQNRLRLYEG
jgi:hypothetical protein